MFTIENLLNLEFIPWSKNLLDTPADFKRQIEYISVNDLPLDDFIRKNEAVLAIARPYLEKPSLMYEFIDGLIQADASIFLLCNPDDIIELTEECKKHASDNNLAVYQLPWSVRFADVIEEVLYALHYNYEQDVEVIKEIQTELVESFLRNDDIDDAIEILSKKLACPVTITYPDGTVIGHQKVMDDMISLPLSTDSATYGYIHLNAALTEKTIAVLQRNLSSLLSLWFYRDEIIETSQRIAKDDFIWSLANGADPLDTEVLRTAEHMKFKLKRSYSCIVGRINLSDIYDKVSKERWVDSNIASIQEKIIDIAKKNRYTIMVTHKSDSLIIYFENMSSSTKQTINHYLDEIEKNITMMNKHVQFSWGISEIKETPTEYKNYYAHAKLAEELCSSDPGKRGRYFYENAIIYRVMSDLYEDDELVEDTLDILKPLLEYEKTKKNGITDTLKAYLTTRNLSETARICDKHRQTVLYHISKIEELTEMSLKNHNDLYLLETCLRMHSGLVDYENK